METTTPGRASLLGLFRTLTSDTRTLIRQEIQLAKTELSEKASVLGRNAVKLAIGGFVAYAGLIVFLIGLGWLLAWAFEKAGLEPTLGGFLGLAIIGLVVITVGTLLLLKGVRTISKESLAPQRTLHTLQELKGTERFHPSEAPAHHEHRPASSAEMQARVEATENQMGETLDELGHRLSPQHINSQVKQSIQANPYRSGLIAMGAGLISGLYLFRRTRRAAA